MKKSKTNLSVLLNDSLISYYYVGFILADGHISNGNRLQMTVSSHDKEYLCSMAGYLGVEHVRGYERTYNGKPYKTVSFSAQDVDVIPKLTKKFDIKSDKTHFPPDIDVLKNFSSDKILSIIIGFIDGDGNIKKQYGRNDFSIAIKCHSSWLKVLEYFSIVITGKNLARINSLGYASLVLSRFTDIKKLKIFALDNRLPIMLRKWGIVNENVKNRTERHIENTSIVSDFLSRGLTISEICKETGLSYSCVYAIIKRHGLKYEKHDKRKKHKRMSGEIKPFKNGLVYV